MRTKSYKKPKINIVTLGCSKNLVDSEVLLSQLRANDLPASHEEQDSESDIVVVNTCGFIDNAKQESIDTILHYAEEKRKGNLKKLFVTGCLSHRYQDELEKEIKEVDQYFGTLELPNILNKLGAEYKHELIGERLSTTPDHYAYLKISEGCNRPCSFCAIPLMRGKHVSKPIEQIVKEAKHLAKNGVKELMLIAQDSTYYGLDLYKKRNLAELLTALGNVSEIEWIRLHYAFPSQFPEDALHVIADTKNICKYLDMPLQHATDNMLKAMRRGITRSITEALLEKIRSIIPNVALRTTMMVGHPGESEADFLELCDFVSEQKFDRLGVFTYSHEENTHAYTLADTIPQEEKDRRAAELMKIQEGISEKLNQQKVGSTMNILFDRKEGEYFIGRSYADSPEVDNEVLVDARDNYIRIGDFAPIEITDCTAFDLFGKTVKDANSR